MLQCCAKQGLYKHDKKILLQTCLVNLVTFLLDKEQVHITSKYTKKLDKRSRS